MSEPSEEVMPMTAKNGPLIPRGESGEGAATETDLTALIAEGRRLVEAYHRAKLEDKIFVEGKLVYWTAYRLPALLDAAERLPEVEADRRGMYDTLHAQRDRDGQRIRQLEAERDRLAAELSRARGTLQSIANETPYRKIETLHWGNTSHVEFVCQMCSVHIGQARAALSESKEQAE